MPPILAQRKLGFTQIELLVAITVCLLLMAQFAPAVLQSRAAAQISKCQNNLKTIGLALHNYHDTYNMMPPGFVQRNSNLATQQGFGWMGSILPYIDQASVYNHMLPDGGGLLEAAKDPTRQAAMRTRIALYRCPADTTPDFNAYRGNWPTSNYSGNGGHRAFPRIIGDGVTHYWPGHPPSQNVKSTYFPNAIRSEVFAVNYGTRLASVMDGTSNTVAVGERGASSLAGIWVGVTAGSHENDALTDMSHLSRPNTSWSSFSSFHSQSFHVLLLDGSVRRIDDSIQSLPNSDPSKPLGVYQKLGCQNDGQIVEF